MDCKTSSNSVHITYIYIYVYSHSMMLVAALHTIMFMFNSFPSTEDDATFPSTEDAVPLIHPKRAKTKTGSTHDVSKTL